MTAFSTYMSLFHCKINSSTTLSPAPSLLLSDIDVISVTQSITLPLWMLVSCVTKQQRTEGFEIVRTECEPGKLGANMMGVLVSIMCMPQWQGSGVELLCTVIEVEERGGRGKNVVRNWDLLHNIKPVITNMAFWQLWHFVSLKMYLKYAVLHVTLWFHICKKLSRFLIPLQQLQCTTAILCLATLLFSMYAPKKAKHLFEQMFEVKGSLNSLLHNHVYKGSFR